MVRRRHGAVTVLALALFSCLPRAYCSDACAKGAHLCASEAGSVLMASVTPSGRAACGFGLSSPCLWRHTSSATSLGCFVFECAAEGASCRGNEPCGVTCQVLPLATSLVGSCRAATFRVDVAVCGASLCPASDRQRRVGAPELDAFALPSPAPTQATASEPGEESQSLLPTPGPDASLESNPVESSASEVDAVAPSTPPDDHADLVDAAPRSAVVLLVVDDPEQDLTSEQLEHALSDIFDEAVVSAEELDGVDLSGNMTAFAFIVQAADSDVPQAADHVVATLLTIPGHYLEDALGARIVTIESLESPPPPTPTPPPRHKGHSTNAYLGIGIAVGVLVAVIFIAFGVVVRRRRRSEDADGDGDAKDGIKLRRIDVAGIVMDVESAGAHAIGSVDVRVEGAKAGMQQELLDHFFFGEKGVYGHGGFEPAAGVDVKPIVYVEAPEEEDVFVYDTPLHRACALADVATLETAFALGESPALRCRAPPHLTLLHLAVVSHSVEAVRIVVRALKAAVSSARASIEKDGMEDVRSPADSLASDPAAVEVPSEAHGDDGYGSAASPDVAPGSMGMSPVSGAASTPGDTVVPAVVMPDGRLRRDASDESLESTGASSATTESVGAESVGLKRPRVAGVLDAVDDDNTTALGLAARLGLTDIVRLLVAEGADPSVADAKGWAPLHWCAGSGNLEAVELLCRGGARKNQRTKKDQTPLFLAAREGHAEIVAALIDAGADRNARDSEGRTPLSAARGAENYGAQAVFYGAVNGLTQHRPIQPRAPTLLRLGEAV